MKVIEGYMPFMGYKTYYRVVGECQEGKKPLVLLHGGPGSSHNYFEVLDYLAEDGWVGGSNPPIGQALANAIAALPY